MNLSAAFAWFSLCWVKLVCFADRESPALKKKKKKRYVTHAEKDQLAQQMSTALLPAPPPPLHRSPQTLARCLPLIHTFNLSHGFSHLMICTYHKGVPKAKMTPLLQQKTSCASPPLDLLKCFCFIVLLFNFYNFIYFNMYISFKSGHQHRAIYIFRTTGNIVIFSFRKSFFWLLLSTAHQPGSNSHCSSCKQIAFSSAQEEKSS